MRCAVSYNPLRKHRNCQFKHHSDELIEFDGKLWCIFHLPMTNNNGLSSAKHSWDESKTEQFSNHIQQLLDKEFYNFIYVVFQNKYTLNLGNKADFTNELNFKYTQFWGKIDLKGIKFNSGISFNTSLFVESVYIQNCIFNIAINFKKSIFKSRVDFVYSEASNTIFESCRFEGITFFNNSHLKSISLENSEFTKAAHFINTIFGDETKYSNHILFDSSKFYDIVTFRNAIFWQYSDFKYIIFEGFVNFSVDININKINHGFNGVDFTGSKFNRIKFTNREFKGKTNFQDCIFNHAPDFHSCMLHQDTIFPLSQRAFRDVSGIHAANAYRTLGLAMSNLRARREEALFYVLEQKSLLNTNETSCAENIASRLYCLFADYGKSIFRPFLCILITLVLSGLFYASISGTFSLTTKSITVNWNQFFSILSFSFQQAIYIGRIFSASNNAVISKITTEHPWLINIALIQSILSYIFTTFLLFALRWRFKRE